MADRECPSCGAEMGETLTCPDCGHNLASTVVSTGSRVTGEPTDESETPQPGSASESEDSLRSPKEVAANAEGDIRSNSLQRTSGIGGTYLAQPLIEYLRTDEQVEYLLNNRTAGIRITRPDGTEETPDHADDTEGVGRCYLLITDQRILYVAGYEDGDETRVFEYDDIVGVESNRGLIRGRLSFEVADGTTFEFRTLFYADDVRGAAEYVHLMAPEATDPSSGRASKLRATPGYVSDKIQWWNTDLWRGITPAVLAKTALALAAVPGVLINAGILTEFGRSAALLFLPAFVLVYAGVSVHWYLLALAAMILAVLPTTALTGVVAGLDPHPIILFVSVYLGFVWIAGIILTVLYLFEVLSAAFVVGGIFTVLTHGVLASVTPLPGSASLLLAVIPGLFAALVLIQNFEYVIICSTATTGAVLAGASFVLVRAGRAARGVDALDSSASAVSSVFTSGSGSAASVIDPLLELGIDVTLDFYAIFLLTAASGIVVQTLLYEDRAWLVDVIGVWRDAVFGSDQSEEQRRVSETESE